MAKDDVFSDKLEAWLKGSRPKTLGNLLQVFDNKSFATLFIVLMFIPALPIPTGGITHLVLEPITTLLAFELIWGQSTVWLPRFMQKVSLGKTTQGKALPFMIRRIRWFERFSRPRLHDVVVHHQFGRLIGLIVLIFTAATFIAPPFSGLDTLPAMGIVAISLSVILEDIVLWFIGLGLGLTGIALELFLAGAIVHFFRTAF